MSKINNVTLVGAGNVAAHLAMAVVNSGMNVVQVYSRSNRSASMLAGKLNVPFCTDPQQVSPGSDLYILALSDDAITEISSLLPITDELAVHTSGSLDLNILNGTSENTGVFYPLQTFSKNRDISLRNVPVCIETNSPENTEKLADFAAALSDKVYCFPSEKRKILHLAAVFACNFPNFLFSVSEDLLALKNIPFDILAPLIQETAAKAVAVSPAAAQTGPAIRNDIQTIGAHLDLLHNEPAIRDLYKIITEMIIRKHHQNGSL
ncbi:MAG: DUF2520 domain-containing protein [Bacteroidales bacterium]|nr:DUF2520 domain-containing protein [Bacteroidales bacterium]